MKGKSNSAKAISKQVNISQRVTEEDVLSAMNARKVQFHNSIWGLVRVFLNEFPEVIPMLIKLFQFVILLIFLQLAGSPSIVKIGGFVAQKFYSEIVSKIREKPK